MSTISIPKVGLSDEAIAERRKAIGASDVAAILGVSPYASAWDVWAEKTGRIESWKGNEATRLGQYLEAGVLDYAESELNTALLRNVRIPYIGGPIVSTLDAMIEEDGTPVEIKTAGMTGPLHGDWGDAGTDQIPEHYLCQVHTQLLCTEAEFAYLFALLAGRGIVRYQIERSESLCQALAVQLSDWWDKHIIDGIEPSRESASMEVVKRLKRVPNRVITMREESEWLINTRERLKAEAKDIEERLELTDKALLQELGDAEEGVWADGRAVTYFEQHRRGYTVEPTSYRVLRVKKAKGKGKK